jgi:phosphatidylglycerophosphate synthase
MIVDLPEMQKLTLVPLALSLVRIAVLPFFFFLYNAGDTDLCLILFAISVFSDFFDGYLARKLNVITRFGSYVDASADFVFIIAIFTFFIQHGLYPIWLVLLIAASFVIFVVSSRYTRKLYDPVGKYTGSALYIGIVLTIVLPSQATFAFVKYAFIGFFMVSLVSRTISLTKKPAKKACQ